MARNETVNFKIKDDVRDGWLFVIRKKTKQKSDTAFIKIEKNNEHERLFKKAKALMVKTGKRVLDQNI